MIHVGTCGGLAPELTAGDLVIATAAMQYIGYGRETVPPGYPAVADLESYAPGQDTIRATVQAEIEIALQALHRVHHDAD